MYTHEGVSRSDPESHLSFFMLQNLFLALQYNYITSPSVFFLLIPRSFSNPWPHFLLTVVACRIWHLISTMCSNFYVFLQCDHLVLSNQPVCSFPRKTISLILSTFCLPISLYVGLRLPGLFHIHSSIVLPLYPSRFTCISRIKLRSLSLSDKCLYLVVHLTVHLVIITVIRIYHIYNNLKLLRL